MYMYTIYTLCIYIYTHTCCNMVFMCLKSLTPMFSPCIPRLVSPSSGYHTMPLPQPLVPYHEQWLLSPVGWLMI